jgi:hypothetical protein
MSIEGSASAIFTGGTVGTIDITTSGTDRIIVIQISSEMDDTPQSVASVTASGLTFALRKQFQSSFSSSPTHDTVIEIWWAYAAAQQTGTTITVTLNVTTDNASLIVFGVVGATDFSAPWDVNGSLPATNSGASSIPSCTGISTTSTDSIIFGFYATYLNGMPSAGSGYTQIVTAENTGGTNYSYSMAQYQSVGAAQSGITVAAGTSEIGWGWVVDAISGGGGSPPPPAFGAAAMLIGR